MWERIFSVSRLGKRESELRFSPLSDRDADWFLINADPFCDTSSLRNRGTAADKTRAIKSSLREESRRGDVYKLRK